MTCSWGIIISTILMIVSMHSDQVLGMPPAQCSPGLLDEVPPRIRKVCITLSTIYELGTAMENYINDKVPILRENNPLPGNAVKRQDIDHVFLRFGRRR